MSPTPYTWGVMLVNNRLYASDMTSGFWQLDPLSLQPVAGGNNVTERYGADLWVKGSVAYTGTWGGSPRDGARGNAVKIWNLSPSGAPSIADSIVIEGIYCISDIEVSDNGRLLVFSVEGPTDAGLYVYDLEIRSNRRRSGTSTSCRGSTRSPWHASAPGSTPSRQRTRRRRPS